MRTLSLTVYSSQISLAFDVTSPPSPTFGFGDRVSWKPRLTLTSYPHFLRTGITGMRLHAWFNVTFELFRKDKG